LSAIKRSIQDERPKQSNIYGGGNAGQKIAGLLATVPLRYHKKILF
jgi:hypothetical protein